MINRKMEKRMVFAHQMDMVGKGVIAFWICMVLMLLLQNIWFVVIGVFAPMAFMIIAKFTGGFNMSIFKWFEKVNDLEERHGALVLFFKLKERLIPRHWEVYKPKEIE